MTGINLPEALKEIQSKRKRRRFKPPKPSKQVQAWYRDNLLHIVKSLQDIAIEEFSKLTLNDAPSKPQTDKQKEILIRRKLSRVTERLSALDMEKLSSTLSSELARRASEQNKRQMILAYKNCFGVDLTGLLSDKQIKRSLDKAIANNVGLIKSIKNDFIKDIGKAVNVNLLNGGRHENLIALIQARGEVSFNRAKLIARDQAAKLNSDISRERTVSLGLEWYEWSGSGDERERDSHSVLNGMICKYSDPTVYSDDGGKTWKPRSAIGAFIGHPGEDYQCRCVAIPYFPKD